MVLNNEQEKVLEELQRFIKSNKNEILLLGAAGCGKTFLLAEFIKTLSKHNIAVATLSHKAKTVIRGKIPNLSNVKFHTLASLLNMKLNMETGDFTEEGKNPIIQDFDVIIIDEMSMLSEDVLKLIRKKKSKKCKIVFAGDFRQLPPIGEKQSALERDVFISKLELTERVRQGNNNTILEYSDQYGDAGSNKINPIRISDENVKHYTDFNKVLQDYKKDFERCLIDPDNIKVVCYRNSTKKQVNDVIREIIFNKASEIPYQTGDVIIMDNNYQNLLENSQELTVISSEMVMEGNYLLYKIKCLKTNSLDKNSYILHVLNQFSVEQHKKDVAELFDKYKKTKNKNVLTDAWNLKLKYAEVSYNYCLSAHKSQGSGYSKTIILEDDIMKSFMSQKEKNQCMYVAITRSKEQAIIVKQ